MTKRNPKQSKKHSQTDGRAMSPRMIRLPLDLEQWLEETARTNGYGSLQDAVRILLTRLQREEQQAA